SIPANEEGLTAKLAFLPLMHELLAGSVKTGDAWMNLTVGESLEIPSNIRMTATPTLKDAQQTDVVLEQTSKPEGGGVYRSRALVRPGLYKLSTGNRSIPIAVNVPAEEADIRPVDPSVIRKSLGEIDIDFQSDQLPPISENASAGNDYGWTIMTIVLA